MRNSLITAVVVLLPALGFAQDAPASKPAKPKYDWTKIARVSVDAESTLDKNKDKPNGLQYFLWERLNHFRLRVDAVKPINSTRFDKYVRRVTSWWEKKSPSKNHPVKLKLIASQQTTYNASKFYGEAQAHNFKGKIKAQLQNAEGDVVATWAVDHSWGKLIRSGMSKTQVYGLYNQMLHTALAMAILTHDAIRKRLTEANQKKLNTWVKKEKAKLLKVIEGSTKAVKAGEFAKFVRKIPVQAEEPKGSK